MQLKKRSILFWAMIAVGLICSLILLGGRLRAEWNDRNVACAISYDYVQQLAAADGRSEAQWLEDLSAAGVHYLVITDENEQEGLPAAQAAGMEIGRAGDTAQAGDAFLMPPEPESLDSKSYDAYDAPKGDGSVPLALVENYTRTGVVMPESFDPDTWSGPMVKTLYLYDAYSYHYEQKEPSSENENILFRAVTDRSMRLIVLTPLQWEEGGTVTDPAAYADMLSGLSERLSARGLTLGDSFSMREAPSLNRVLLAGAVLLLAAMGVLLICLLFPVTPVFEQVLLAVCAIGAVGCALVLPVLTQTLAAFGAAVVAPCYGVLMLAKIADGRETTLGRWPLALQFLTALGAMVGIGIAGGLYVGSLLASRRYLLEFDVFSGVKLAQILPLALAAIVLLVVLMQRHARQPSRQKVSLPLVIVMILCVIAALVLLVLRSGDNMIPVAEFERNARDWLEHVLYARPRTKEMLMAFPVLALFVTACERRLPVFELPFGILASIGAVSIVNTFCHIFTPVHVSLIRTLLSAVIGLVIGYIGMAVFRVLLGKEN